jgi:hypothetical protein
MNCKRAIALLGGALQKSKESMLYENENVDESHESSLATLLGSCMNQRFALVGDDIDEHEIDHESEDFIYSKGICIPFQPPSDQFRLLLSLSIVFNLALAYQLSSLYVLNDVERRQRLVKASQLYRLAHRLHKDENVHSTIYAIACVNNLAVVSKHLDDHVTCSSCFDHILSTIMFMVTRGEQNEIGNEIHGLFQNVTNNQRNIVKTAPAA